MKNYKKILRKNLKKSFKEIKQKSYKIEIEKII